MAIHKIPKRVLVIDADAELANLMADRFILDGHEAFAAYGGAEGIQSAMNLRPDIVVIDLLLPEFDGFTVAKSLRQHYQAEGLVLVAYSSWGGDRVMTKALFSGFNYYFTKPDGLEDVLQLVSGT